MSKATNRQFCMTCEHFIKPERVDQHSTHCGPVVSVRATAAPSLVTMERWSDNCVAKAIDGCRVEPDGTCTHGFPSWMRKLGVL